MTFDKPNYDRSDNEWYIASLVSDHNYIDRGWTNKGADFKGTIDPIIGLEEINCSMYKDSLDHLVYVNHLSAEILRVNAYEYYIERVD